MKFEVAQNDALAQSFGSDYLCFKYHELPIDKQSLAGYVALTGDTLNITDVYQLPDSLHYHFDPSYDQRNRYRTQSMLLASLKDNQKEVIGVLQLINTLDDAGEY